MIIIIPQYVVVIGKGDSKTMWSKIQDELKRQGKSVYWLSKQTGISDNTIYAYKNHGIEPTFSKVCKIADALGVSLDDLREDTDDKN